VETGPGFGSSGYPGVGRASVFPHGIDDNETRETNYWLRLPAASGIVTNLDLKDMIDESHQLIAILTAIIKTTRKNS
jgi:hypothetical protein